MTNDDDEYDNDHDDDDDVDLDDNDVVKASEVWRKFLKVSPKEQSLPVVARKLRFAYLLSSEDEDEDEDGDGDEGKDDENNVDVDSYSILWSTCVLNWLFYYLICFAQASQNNMFWSRCFESWCG